MTTEELDMLKKQLDTTSAAEALSNTLRGALGYAYDTALALIFSNPHGLTPQEAVDALAAQGKFEPLYAQLTAGLGALATLFPDRATPLAPVELVTYRDGGVLGAIVTEVPFDLGRARYPEQASRAAAEAYAAELAS